MPPWKPGQTGNPAGHSKGRRTATKLRAALDIIVESAVPDELLRDLPSDVLQSLPDGITFAELIALRVVIVGARAPKLDQILSAANMILQAQTKPDLNGPPLERHTPILPATEERRLAIARQLGLLKPKRKRKSAKKKAKRKPKPKRKRAKK